MFFKELNTKKEEMINNLKEELLHKDEDKIKDTTTATIRCIPENEEQISDSCAVCGEKAKHMVYIAKQY
jgi:hypothetical protein